MAKELEINGCISIPEDMEFSEFTELFYEFLEQHGCSFGGGTREIIDGKYVD